MTEPNAPPQSSKAWKTRIVLNAVILTVAIIAFSTMWQGSHAQHPMDDTVLNIALHDYLSYEGKYHRPPGGGIVVHTSTWDTTHCDA